MPFGSEGLVISWVGPAPGTAKVTYTDGQIFNTVARVTGRDIPKGFPEKYTQDLHEVEMFNATMAWSTNEVTSWHKRYLGEIGQEPLSIFEEYLRTGHVIFGTLVQHPPVNPDAAQFRACSTVLQRGVIVHARASPGRETLFLRSYLHSAKDPQTFVNFVPRGGVQMSFASDTIWFPLELTRVIQEPASYVVLDILTTKALGPKQIPQPFRIEEEGRMRHEGERYHVTRITATLAAKQKWPDLKITP
jgi:hypothetical protein